MCRFSHGDERLSAGTLVCCLLWRGLVRGGDVVITLPDGPIIAGADYAEFLVSGLSDDELRVTKIMVTPAAGTKILRVKEWDGTALILFRAQKPDKYNLSPG